MADSRYMVAVIGAGPAGLYAARKLAEGGARVVLDDLRRASHDLGIAVLCNLHQVGYALEFADRIVGIHAGAVVFDGSPKALDEATLARDYPGLETAGLREEAA